MAWQAGLLCLKTSRSFDPKQITQVSSCFHSNNEHEPWRYQSRNNWKPSAHERFTRECATSCTECIKYFYFAWVQSVVWSFCDAVGGPRLVQWHVILREKRRKMSRSMPVSVGALFFSGGWEENYLNWVVYGGLGTVCPGLCIFNKYQRVPHWTLHGLIALGLICLLQR